MLVWKRSGVELHWPAAGKRDASNSRSAFRTSTQERKTPKASLGFPRQIRITRGAELQRIVREGKRIRTVHLEVRAAASPLARSESPLLRIGLVIPRFKQTAVARNRLKRRLRELSRRRLIPSGLSADVVIRIRPEAYSASFAMLADDIDHALVQLSRWLSVAISVRTNRRPSPEEGA